MENLLTCDRGSINVFCPGKEQIDIGYIRVKGLWVVFRNLHFLRVKNQNLPWKRAWGNMVKMRE